jgi:prepilin-type N-terminal cleavage/methylation domain-containing protein/prepilin-type processing-associated H-X9-DG protein
VEVDVKRAFTLIELLVVIAIIAILAAILFPVFAQAKQAAKKTAAISNTKQHGLGIIQYMADHDDSFPCMYSVASNGTYWFNYPIAQPAGWDYNGAYEEDDSQAWCNSTFPYTKNFDIITGPGQNIHQFSAATYLNPRKPFKNGSISANGLLSTMSGTSVAQPAKLTLAWFGNMKEEIKGYNFTNPGLYCNGVGPCRFNPDALPQPGSSGNGGAGDVAWYTYSAANDTSWVYGKSMPFVFVDGHVKAYQMQGSDQPTPAGQMVTNYNDPAMRYGARGQHLSYHRCSNNGTGTRYLSFFRPDSEFNYQFGNTAGVLCR